MRTKKKSRKNWRLSYGVAKKKKTTRHGFFFSLCASKSPHLCSSWREWKRFFGRTFRAFLFRIEKKKSISWQTLDASYYQFIISSETLFPDFHDLCGEWQVHSQLWTIWFSFISSTFSLYMFVAKKKKKKTIRLMDVKSIEF